MDIVFGACICYIFTVVLDFEARFEWKLCQLFRSNNDCIILIFLGIIFSAFSGLATMTIYDGLFLFVLRKMPNSFTYGEAAIVLQGFVIFLTNLYFKLIFLLQKTTECLKDTNSLVCAIHSNNHWTQNHEHFSEMDKLSTILQVKYDNFRILIRINENCMKTISFTRLVFSGFCSSSPPAIM